MTKDSLKVGMIVELRNGDLYIVMKQNDCMFMYDYKHELMCIENWNNNLQYTYGSRHESHDIMVIRNPMELFHYKMSKWKDAPIIWERNEKQTIKIFNREIEFTSTEIEELKKLFSK